MDATLPSFLKYKSASDLVRIGRSNDGGYLISERDIKESEVLVGLGINDDWSFEEDFVSRNDVPVLAYDASVSKRHFARQILKNFVRIDNPKLFLHWLRVYFAYRRFFKGSRRHIEKFVGLNCGGKHVSMTDVLSELSTDRIFLKIDIEGSEYRILEELIQNRHRIAGMVIEFHDCDLHLERIGKFVDNISMPIIHIHANNCVPLERENGLPLVLEITFSRNAEVGGKCLIPHNLDMPNIPTSEEVFLKFG